MVDMFGSAGGLMEHRAALLASRGFAALSLAIFAYEDLPEELDHLDLSYFQHAVDYLLSRPEVMEDGCYASASFRLCKPGL